MSVLEFNKTKVYQHFGELLRDAVVDYATVESGIVILFDKDGGLCVLPVCTQSQCALAAADLLCKAVDK